jgi:hypothetical protein
MMKRLAILFTLTLAFAAVSASVSSAKLPIGTEDTCAAVFTEDASACGQDINWHGYDECVPYPIVNAPYAWNCWNPVHGWHPHYARL